MKKFITAAVLLTLSACVGVSCSDDSSDNTWENAVSNGDAKVVCMHMDDCKCQGNGSVCADNLLVVCEEDVIQYTVRCGAAQVCNALTKRCDDIINGGAPENTFKINCVEGNCSCSGTGIGCGNNQVITCDKDNIRSTVDCGNNVCVETTYGAACQPR